MTKFSVRNSYVSAFSIVLLSATLFSSCGNMLNDFAELREKNQSVLAPIVPVIPDKVKYPVTLASQEVMLIVGQGKTLEASTASEGGALSFESADPAIATVSAEGLVNGVSAGCTSITARNANGDSAACQIQVVSQGDGSAESPILIFSAEQLDAVRNKLDGNYRLVCDIDLSGYDNWIPVGTESTPFIGSLDGNGCTIKNMRITSYSDSGYSGLFGVIGENGRITRLAGSGKIESNSLYVGVLAGINYGKISQCQTSGEIEATCETETYVGGMVGHNYDSGHITQSHSYGTILTLEGMVGGLVCLNWGEIDNCYTLASIKPSSEMGGGFCGENVRTIGYSYAAGKFLPPDVTNTFAFTLDRGHGSVSDSYYDKESYNYGYQGSLGSLETTAEMKTRSTYMNWNFGDGGEPAVWAIDPTINDGYPYLVGNPPRL